MRRYGGSFGYKGPATLGQTHASTSASGLAALNKQEADEARLKRLDAMKNAAVHARAMDPDNPEDQQRLATLLEEAGLSAYGRQPVFEEGATQVLDSQRPVYDEEGRKQGLEFFEGTVQPAGSPPSERPQVADAMQTYNALIQRFRMENPSVYAPRTTGPGQVARDPITGEVIDARPTDLEERRQGLVTDMEKPPTDEDYRRLYGVKPSDLEERRQGLKEDVGELSKEDYRRLYGLKVAEGAEKKDTTTADQKPPSPAKALQRISDIEKARATLEKGEVITAIMAKTMPELADYFGKKIPEELKQRLYAAWDREIAYLNQFIPRKGGKGGGGSANWKDYDY